MEQTLRSQLSQETGIIRQNLIEDSKKYTSQLADVLKNSNESKIISFNSNLVSEISFQTSGYFFKLNTLINLKKLLTSNTSFVIDNVEFKILVNGGQFIITAQPQVDPSFFVDNKFENHNGQYYVRFLEFYDKEGHPKFTDNDIEWIGAYFNVPQFHCYSYVWQENLFEKAFQKFKGKLYLFATIKTDGQFFYFSIGEQGKILSIPVKWVYSIVIPTDTRAV